MLRLLSLLTFLVFYVLYLPLLLDLFSEVPLVFVVEVLVGFSSFQVRIKVGFDGFFGLGGNSTWLMRKLLHSSDGQLMCCYPVLWVKILKKKKCL